LSGGASPQIPLGELTALPRPWFRGRAPGEREGGRRREKQGGEGVPLCPNPELASLL